MRVKFAGRLLKDDLMDRIRYVCKCGGEYWLPAEMAGTEFRCFACGHKGIIHTPPTTSAEYQRLPQEPAVVTPPAPQPHPHHQNPQGGPTRQPYPWPCYYPYVWPPYLQPAAESKPLTPANPMKTGKLLCIIGGVALATAVIILVVALLLMP